ncbi:MAG: EamA family transporter [Methylococcales bacterium]|nr:EamA family transporter [Methylococcales bacterium]
MHLSYEFRLYYYVLKHTGPDMVALITLITPVTALILGAQLNNEIITVQVWIGTLFIMLGLGVYLFAGKIKARIAS